MKVDVHKAVEHGLHELVVERLEVVVGELDPLETVEVLERGRLDLLDVVVLQPQVFDVLPEALEGVLFQPRYL